MSEEINLWTSLLQESSKRSQIPESTCIIVGDPNSGKKQLLQKICNLQSSSEGIDFQKELISYSYFDIDEGYLESISRVNVWSFDHHIFNNAFEIIGDSNKTDKLLFLVILDLSKPDQTISSLNKWLLNIANYVGEYHSGLTTENSIFVKQSNVQHLKSARLNKGDVNRAPAFSATSNINQPQTPTKQQSQNGLNAGDDRFEFVVDHFSLPIVVVGSKCDSVDVSDGLSMRRAREVQGQLRSICLDIGAALVYCSSVTEMNCSQLKKYVSHRLYPEDIPVEGGLQIEDKVDVTFIPAGFDTVDLISIASGLPVASSSTFKSGFEQEFRTHAAQLSASLEASELPESALVDVSLDAGLELETEQEWLSGLHSFVLQVAATGGVASSGMSRLPSNLSDPSLALLGGSGSAAESESNSGAPSPNLNPGEAEAKRTASFAGGIASGTAPIAPKVSRRQSVVKPAAAGEKEDVSDFFKNLMK